MGQIELSFQWTKADTITCESQMKRLMLRNIASNKKRF